MWQRELKVKPGCRRGGASCTYMDKPNYYKLIKLIKLIF
jgi:hypothetical protein